MFGSLLDYVFTILAVGTVIGIFLGIFSKQIYHGAKKGFKDNIL